MAGSEALGRSAEALEDSAVLDRSPAALTGSEALGRSAAVLEGSRALGRCAAGLVGSEGGIFRGSEPTWLGLEGRVGLFNVTFSFLVGPPDAALSAPGSRLCSQHTRVFAFLCFCFALDKAFVCRQAEKVFVEQRTTLPIMAYGKWMIGITCWT